MDNKLLWTDFIARRSNGIQKIGGKLPYKIQHSDIYGVTSFMM